MCMITKHYQKNTDLMLMISNICQILKSLLNQYNSDELYNVWNYFRMDYLRRNPSILGLE
jgi:hypothetical protein